LVRGSQLGLQKRRQVQRNKRVLVVDDEAYVVRSLGFVLQQAGYTVLEARDGQQAMEIVLRERPDLVFLDIMLPRLDGIEVCRAIKASGELRSIPVIMLTAKSQETDREEALAAGADEYMTKPFSPSRAVERANSLLGEGS